MEPEQLYTVDGDTWFTQGEAPPGWTLDARCGCPGDCACGWAKAPTSLCMCPLTPDEHV